MDDDTALLEAWRRGDMTAGSRLFDRHFESVRRFFKNKCPGQMEDLIQDTFLGCVEGRNTFRGDSSFRTYIFAIAKNVLYGHLRRRGRDGDRIDFGVTSIEAIGPTPSRIVAMREEHRMLASALRQIPVDYQVALELYYFEGLRGPEIADVLGVAEGTVRSRLRRGLERLRERLAALAPSSELVAGAIRELDGEPGSLATLVDALPPPPAPS